MGLVRDPWETDDSRRFKALYFHVPPTEEEVGGGVVRHGASPDGIHWTPLDEPPVVGAERARLDDTAIVAVDPESRGYLAITRHPFMVGAPDPLRLPPLGPTGGTPTFDVATDQPGGRNRRRVFMMESADFHHWTRPPTRAGPPIPISDNLDTSFYGMSLYRIGAQWLGFMGVFNMVSNTMHVELTHSRDGRTWRRVWPGRPWLEPGPPGAWDQFMVNVSSAPVANDGELRIYYGGSRNHHDWWFAGPPEQYAGSTAWDHLPEVNDTSNVGYALGLARMRPDGFVSLDAGREREGLIVTEPAGRTRRPPAHQRPLPTRRLPPRRSHRRPGPPTPRRNRGRLRPIHRRRPGPRRHLEWRPRDSARRRRRPRSSPPRRPLPPPPHHPPKRRTLLIPIHIGGGQPDNLTPQPPPAPQVGSRCRETDKTRLIQNQTLN